MVINKQTLDQGLFILKCFSWRRRQFRIALKLYVYVCIHDTIVLLTTNDSLSYLPDKHLRNVKLISGVILGSRNENRN